MAFQNPYFDKLSEFAAFVFNGPSIKANRGKWIPFFEKRGVSPRKLVLEIGCSNAEFLSEVASANKEAAFVGIDWKFKILYKGAQKVDRKKLLNVALVRARAQEIADMFGEAELDEVWIFFPDPWAKKSQLKHRLIQEQFLLELRKVIKPGGKLYLKTDHPGYYQWMLAIFGEPLPELPEYGAPEPDEKSYKSKQIKVRRVEDPELLPQKSAPACGAFRLDRHLKSYWSVERPPTMFSERHTLFEEGFVKDELPIYYLELTAL